MFGLAQLMQRMPRERQGGLMAQQPQQQQQQPMGQPMGGSAGLFDQYMQQLWQQRYAPPMMQGSPWQSFGGFMGFAPPKMTPISQRGNQQQQQPRPMQPDGGWMPGEGGA